MAAEFHWQTKEYEYHEKDIFWYWASIIIAVGIVAFAVWQKNFLFAAFVIIAEILVLVWAERKPDTIEFMLNEDGIKAAERYFPLSDIESFGVQKYTEAEDAVLILRFKKRFSSSLSIPVPKDKIDEIHHFLSGILEEQEVTPSLIDAITRFLRF